MNAVESGSINWLRHNRLALVMVTVSWVLQGAMYWNVPETPHFRERVHRTTYIQARVRAHLESLENARPMAGDEPLTEVGEWADQIYCGMDASESGRDAMVDKNLVVDPGSAQEPLACP